MAQRSTEAGLVCACARRALTPAARAGVVEVIENGLNWALAIEIADGNGVLPLVTRHLLALPPGVLPRPLVVELVGRDEVSARRKRAMTGELLRITGLFDSHGLESLPYKGPALAAQLYGDVTLREYGDLDILLRPRDVLRAKALLQELGYAPQYRLAPAAEDAFLHSSAQYHLVMVHGQRGMVELHWKTDPDFPVEAGDDRWWAALARIPLDKGSVRGFSPEELLLVLCIHGSKHYWNTLGWIVDVGELLRTHPAMDWPRIAGTARRLGCARRLALGLHLAQHLLDAPLPREARADIAGRAELDGFAERIEAALFSPGYPGMAPLEALRCHLGLYERNRDRLRYFANTIFSPSLVEWTRWPLPRALFFLYPGLRLMRLTRKYLLR